MPKISITIKLLILIVFSVLFSSCQASEQELVGQWVKETARGTLTLDISRKNHGIFLSYCFIYSDGKRINCPTNDDGDKFELIETNNNCYKSSIHSYYNPSAKASIRLCERNNKLLWHKLNKVNSPYIPGDVEFRKDN